MRIYAFLCLLLIVACSTKREEEFVKSGEPEGKAYPVLYKDGTKYLWALNDRRGFTFLDKITGVDYVSEANGGHPLIIKGGRYGFLPAGGKNSKAPYRYAKKSNNSFGPALDTLGRWGYASDTNFYHMPGAIYTGVFSGKGATILDASGYQTVFSHDLFNPVRQPYERVFDYHNGYAVFEQSGKYGFLDNKGQVVLSPQYDGATGIGNGRAYVLTNKGWIRIDTTGNRVGTDIYTNVYGYTEGLSAVQLGNQWGYTNPDGKVVLAFKYDSARPFENGIALVKQMGSWGYILPDGKPAFDKKQLAAFEFIDGLAPAEEKGLQGYLRPDGTWGISPQFENGRAFSEGLAAVVMEGKVGYIDMAGRFVIQPTFESGQEFKAGIAPAKKDGKWGYINRKGEWVLQPQFDGALPAVNYDLLPVLTGELLGFYHRDGRMLLPAQYTGLPEFMGGKALLMKGNLPVYVDVTGRER